MKKLKSIIFILFIIIILISIILIIFIKNAKQESNSVENKINHEDRQISIDNFSIKPITEKNQFYTIEDCVQKFINYSYMDINSNIYQNGLENSNFSNIKTEDERKDAIISLLDKEFISYNSINKNNLYNYVKTGTTEQKFTALKMNILPSDIINIEVYLVYGKIENIENEETQNNYFLVKIDRNNMTFSIYPLDKNKYSNINDIKTNIKEILKNDYNTFDYLEISDAKMATKYFNDYKDKMLNDYEEAYDLLDNEYKLKRFESISNFKEYRDENIEEIKKTEIKSFLVNYYTDYNEYVCKDQYENLYIFKEKAVMDYTLKLDTYTITPEKFEKTYNNVSDDKKVQMNIDKFIQMINRQDYLTSYKYVDDGFKKNYLPTENEFKKFIENNFYKYNKIEYKNYENKGNGIYIYTIELADLTKENEEIKEITIIMQLKDGLDFKVAFGMN